MSRLGFRPRAWILLLPAVAFLLLLMVLPVGELLTLSFTNRGDGAWSLANYQRLFSTPVYLRVLAVTFRCAAWTTGLCVLVGYPLAYWIATSEQPARTRLLFWVLLPFWTSFLVRTFAWIVLLGRNGLINQWLLALGLIDAPASMLYTFSAVTVGMMHALMPLGIVTMVATMENIDGNLSRAALTLGAPPGSTFWRIYVPLSLPGAAAGGLLVFVSALGFFIAPALLGGPRDVMLVQIIIQQVQDLLNWQFSGALSVLLLVAALAVFALYDRLFGLSTLAGAAPARAGGAAARFAGRASILLLGLIGRVSDRLLAWSSFGSRRWRMGGRGPILRGFGVAVLLFLGAPAVLMVPISFTSVGVLDWPPRGFSLAWYQSYFESTQWLLATVRSFEVACLTGLLATLLGVAAAFGLARGLRRGNTAMLGLLLSPLIVPRIVVSIALFYLFARIGLVGTTTGLVLGHTILAIPYVVVTMMAALKTYDLRYDEAAWSLGANRLRCLWHITLPLMRAGILAAFVFAFVTSFDELTIALFITGGLSTTVPKQMWDSAVLQVNPTLAAVSTLLLVFITAMIMAGERLGRRDRAPAP